MRAVFIFVLLTCMIYLMHPLHCEDTETNIVIVMDVYHDPALTNFTKAIGYLNDSFNGTLRYYELNNSINQSTLSGVAVYIVPPSNRTFTDQEKRVLEKYVQNGGILVVLGMDYLKGRDFNSDIIILDDLISSLPLDTEIHFNYTRGLGNTVIDPLSNDSYLHINESHYSESLREFLDDETFDLIVESSILTIDTINLSAELVITPPSWSYALTGDGTILYFESGAAIFAMEKLGDGYVIVFGFSISLSDIIEPNYGVAWIDIAQNKEFLVSLFKKVIHIPSKGSYNEKAVTLLWMGPTIIGTCLTVISAVIIAKRKRVVRVVEKKEVRLAEVLREMRRKKK